MKLRSALLLLSLLACTSRPAPEEAVDPAVLAARDADDPRHWAVERKPSNVDEQLAAMDPKKLNACMMTINSDDEKKVFTKYNSNEFNIIELVSSDPNWFQRACRAFETAKAECDILLVSAHFGGAFFGDNATRVPLEELEEVSCMRTCEGILRAKRWSGRRQQFFGCNTLADKDDDHRTPEAYRQVLIQDGFTPAQAQEIAAARYSPIGSSFHDRMARVFQGVPRLYGFSSRAPLGKDIRPRLERYYRTVGNYRRYLERLAKKGQDDYALKGALKKWKFRESKGSTQDDPACVLMRPAPRLERLRWVRTAIRDPEERMAYAVFMSRFFLRNERDGVPWTAEEKAVLEQITNDKEARDDIGGLLAHSVPGLESLQIGMLNLGRSVGWWDAEGYSAGVERVLGPIFATNLTLEAKDRVCSMGVPMNLPLARLPARPWTTNTLQAIECMVPTSQEVTEALIDELKKTDVTYAHFLIFRTFGEIKSKDVRVHRALAAQLRDPREEHKLPALKALAAMAPDDGDTQLAILERALEDTDNQIRWVATKTLRHIGSVHPSVAKKIRETPSADADLRALKVQPATGWKIF